MEKRFLNQVAIITGGARGIGAGIAKRLLSEGAKVILFDVLEKQLHSFVKAQKDGETPIEAKLVDISNEVEVAREMKAVREKYGSIDIVVNCAGIIGPSATNITDYSFEDFRKVIDVNLHGSFLICKAVLPYMLEKNYGRILLLSSIGGKEGNPGMIGYAASKAGVIGMTKALGKEFAQSGITINAIAPAVISTEMNLETDPKMLEYMAAKIPMGRLGTVEEVAALACWIISKEASFNTGFIFDLTGGRATY